MSETLAYDIIARDVGASRTFDNVGDAIGDAAKQSKDFKVAQAALSKQINDTEKHLKSLIAQIDGSEQKELFKAIRKDQSLMAFLKRAEKQLNDGGRNGGRGFLSGFLDGLSGLPSQLKGSAIAAGIAVAPLVAAPVGAAIGGAVLGAAGLGGIVGGVIAAAQDERVAMAGADLGKNFMSGFKDAGRLFISPLLDQMATLGRTEDIFVADLAAGFAKLGPVLKPVVDGLEGFADNLNLDEVFGDSLPAVRALAQELPEIGAAIGDAFAAIGDESDGATEGFISLLHATEDLIVGTGEFIGFLSGAYDWMVRTDKAATQWALDLLDTADAFAFLGGAIGSAEIDVARSHLQDTNDVMTDLTAGLDDAKDAGDDWRGSLADQAKASAEAAKEAKDYLDALHKLFGIQMSLDEANIRYQEAIDNTVKTLKDGKKTLDINTEAGRENRKAVLDQIQAIEDLRQANINNGMSVEDANNIARGQLDTLVEIGVHAGFARKKMHELVDAYKDAQKNAYVSTHIDDDSVTSALKHIKAVEAEMERLNGNVSTVYVRTVFGEYRAGERNPSGRASGGPVAAGTMYWVGENGPELVRFAQSGQVYSNTQSRAMAARSTTAAAPASTVPATPEALARAVRSALQGMSVVLDRRIVGELTGRDADVYQRGG